MEQDNKNASGAPSTDTTSALFVSARKKQLEQQETERRAKEKEEQRLAAEAEVRRLEAEVEARRRKAEEDARRVEAEAAEKMRQAAENASAVAAQPQTYQPVRSAAPKPASEGGIAALLANKKMLAIIGGALAGVVVLVVVLALALGGNKAKTPYITANGLNISGMFYDADDPDTSFSFYEDGSMEFMLGDGSLVPGTYSIGGETITAITSGITLTFEVKDENTLVDAEGYEYRRAIGGVVPVVSLPEEEPEASPPKASDLLDATVTLADYNMTLKYPSASFEIFQNEGSSVMFVSRVEDLGAIAITMTEYSMAGYSNDEQLALLEVIGEATMENFLENYDDAQFTESYAWRNDANVLEYIGEGTFTDYSDFSCRIFVRVSFRDETKTAYVQMAMARNSYFDICKSLVIRVKDTISFG